MKIILKMNLKIFISLFQIWLSLFFINSMCFAELICISLGENCNAAMALSKHGLRKQALPFDWNVTPFDSLYRIFKNDFSNFLSAEYLFISDDLHTVINRYYDIAFAHDFPTYDSNWQDSDELATPVPGVIKSNFLDVLPRVQEKYSRRIKRLYSILNGDDEVLFIRHNHKHIQKKEIIKFCQLIESKFPELRFTLVIWGYENEMRENWGHPRIKTYQLVKGDGIESFYERLFLSLNLIY